MPEVEEVKEVQTEAPQWQHPVLLKKIHEYNLDWKTWKAEWDRVGNFQLLMNLLHIGFDASVCHPYSYRREGDPAPTEWRERIIFYLELAYNYASGWSFKEDSYYDSKNSRHELVKKAFHVLCQKLFKGKAETQGYEMAAPEWFPLIVDPVILPKVIWFFSARYALTSSVGEHDAAIVSQFLYDLARMGWMDFDRESTRVTEEQKVLLQKHKPAFLKILWELGELDFLIEVRKSVTGRDMAHLRRLIFTNNTTGERNKFRTVEEALVCDFGRETQAAKIFILLREYRREAQRQERVRDEAYADEQAANTALLETRARTKEVRKAILEVKDLDELVRLKAELESLSQKIPILQKDVEKAQKRSSEIYDRFRGY